MYEADRSRVEPHPVKLDELIPPDHPVRAVWEMVQQLDLEPLIRQIKSVAGHAGRPAIDPAILVALWIYATIEGISSARELARSCRFDLRFRWLAGGVSVGYHTLSDFRVAHAEWLEQQVTRIVAALIKEGLVDLNHVGQDGVRVRASAGSASFHSLQTIEEHWQVAQQQWERLEEEFRSGSSKATAREQAARRQAARERLQRLERAKAAYQEMYAAREERKKGDGEQARASTTDPDARKMKMPNGGFNAAFNVQYATTLDTHVIVGVEVTNSGSDGGQMDPMVARIEEQYQQVPEAMSTDGGYSTVEDIDKVSQRGVTVYTPVKEARRQEAEGKDPYAPRRGDSPAVATWRQRMGTPEGRAMYRERCKCELSNARARARGLQQFLVRGLAKVKAVALWNALAHNVQRALALRAAAAVA